MHHPKGSIVLYSFLLLCLSFQGSESLKKERPSTHTRKSVYKKSPLSKKGFRVWEVEDEEKDVIVVKEKTHSFNFLLQPRTQDCFYLEVENGLTANIEYSVRSVDPSDGSYMHLTAALYGDDPDEALDRFESSRSGFFTYLSEYDHDIKICFSHSGSRQRIVVVLDVITLKSSITTNREANFGRRSFEKIETNVFRSIHQIFLLKTRFSIDLEHVKGISNMINYRSCIYIIMAAAVALTQVAVHKHFFNNKEGVKV